MGFAEATDHTPAAVAHGADTALDSGLYGVGRNHEAGARGKITERASAKPRRFVFAGRNQIHGCESVGVRDIEIPG